MLNGTFFGERELPSNLAVNDCSWNTNTEMWVVGLATPVMIAMLLLFAGSPSVTANDQVSAAAAEVTIDNFSFGPQTIPVPVGATVTWINRDDIPHTSVSTEGVFSLG